MSHTDKKEEFICEICNKYFRDLYNLNRHKAKKSCKKRNECECSGCNVKFANQYNLERHTKSCELYIVKQTAEEPELPIKNIKDVIRVTKSMTDVVNQLQQDVIVLKKENIALRKQVCKLNKICDNSLQKVETNSHNTTTNSHNTTTNNGPVININFNAWNEPSVEHLRSPEMMDYILKASMDAVVQLVEPVWFNKECPENISIHSKNKKTGELLVRTGEDKWEQANTRDICPQMRQILEAQLKEIIKEMPVEKRIHHGDMGRQLKSVQEVLNIRKLDEKRIAEKIVKCKDVSKSFAK